MIKADSSKMSLQSDRIRINTLKLVSLPSSLQKHADHTIINITHGSGLLYLQDELWEFREGDTFYIEANVPYYFGCSVEGSAELRSICLQSIHYMPDSIPGLFELPEMKKFKNFKSENGVAFKIPKDKIQDIASTLFDGRGSKEIRFLIAFIGLLVEVDKLKVMVTTKVEVNNSWKNGKYERFRRAVNFIDANFRERIPLKQVADIACLSTNAFCRDFKKFTGRTLGCYLQDLRIEEVCKRMIEMKGEGQIYTLAYLSGFNSISNFRRAFKSIKGMTPSKYIRPLKLQNAQRYRN